MLVMNGEALDQMFRNNIFAESENLIRNGFRKVICTGMETDPSDGWTKLVWEVER